MHQLVDCSDTITKLNAVIVERSILTQKLLEVETQVTEMSEKIDQLKLVREVMKKLVQVTAGASIKQLNDLVSAGLQDIFFDQNISFDATYFVKQGKPKLEMVFLVDGERRASDLVGGGVIGITSTLLRLVEIRLFKLAPILLLDEPLVHLSDRYLAGAGKFIKNVANKFGILVIMVSHQKEMADSADVIIEARMSPSGLKISEVCNE